MKSDSFAIYVINLDSRPERWSLFCEGSAAWERVFGVCPERFSAVAGVALPGYDTPPWFTRRLSERRKRSWAGKAGCILSHRNAIAKAADLGLDRVLLVEDDAYLTDEMVAAWLGGLQDLVAKLPEDWAVVNFCTVETLPPYRVVAEASGVKLVEASGCCSTVAYLINGKIFERLLEELPDESSIWRWVARHKAIDRWYSVNLQRFGRVYLFAPAVVGHRIGPSDISMSAEHAGELDFSLNDLDFVKNDNLFQTLRWVGRVKSALRTVATIFRYAVKRVGGY